MVQFYFVEHQLVVHTSGDLNFSLFFTCLQVTRKAPQTLILRLEINHSVGKYANTESTDSTNWQCADTHTCLFVYTKYLTVPQSYRQ